MAAIVINFGNLALFSFDSQEVSIKRTDLPACHMALSHGLMVADIRNHARNVRLNKIITDNDACVTPYLKPL